MNLLENAADYTLAGSNWMTFPPTPSTWRSGSSSTPSVPALGGYQRDLGQHAARYASAMMPGDQATLLGTGERVSLEGAAFANAVMIKILAWTTRIVQPAYRLPGGASGAGGRRDLWQHWRGHAGGHHSRLRLRGAYRAASTGGASRPRQRSQRHARRHGSGAGGRALCRLRPRAAHQYGRPRRRPGLRHRAICL